MASSPFVDLFDTSDTSVSLPLWALTIDDDPQYQVPIGNPENTFDYGGYTESEGYKGFGKDKVKDMVLVRRMAKRALDRYEIEGHDTVFVFMWPQDGEPPVIAERIVFKEQQWCLAHDQQLLQRLGSGLHFKRYVHFLGPATSADTWLNYNITHRIVTPLPGTFIFLQQDGVETKPYFDHIWKAFRRNFTSSARGWITERVAVEDLACDEVGSALIAEIVDGIN